MNDFALPGGRAGRLLALGVAVLALVLLWAGVVRPLADWYDTQGDLLAQRQALAARMAGLAASLPELKREQAAAPGEDPPLAMLQGESDAIAAANLQERVQALGNAAGVLISSVEMLAVDPPAGEAAGDRAIRLRLSLRAAFPPLLRLIDLIESGPPLMLVDDIHIEASQLLDRSDGARLQATLTITGFRHLPALRTTARR